MKTDDFSWLGVHSIKIRGQNGAGAKQFNFVESEEISIEFVNPCARSVVLPFELDDMKTSVSVGTNVTQTFTNKPDWISTKYGNKDGF